MELAQFFARHPRVALAFSGGCDSAYLLYAARKHAAQVCAYYVKTAFQPAFELEDAKRLAQQLQAPMKVLELDVLGDGRVAANPKDRCYHCKRAMFARLKQEAERDGFRVLIDGTNASDDAADRPGMVALRELEVLSPLRLCGITKDRVRALSKEAGLFTWDKPAYACLATRIPTGTPIQQQTLSQVETAEEALRRLGFSDLRVRVGEQAAKLQLKADQMAKAVELRERILEELSPYFDQVLLDLKAR